MEYARFTKAYEDNVGVYVTPTQILFFEEYNECTRIYLNYYNSDTTPYYLLVGETIDEVVGILRNTSR